MHDVKIAQSVIDDVIAHRGREHVFEDFDPQKTALLVVDMQNGFMMKGVAHALCETAIEIVPNINRLAQTVRVAGGLVVWIKNTVTPETMTSWSVRDEMDGQEELPYVTSIGDQRVFNPQAPRRGDEILATAHPDNGNDA